MIDRQNRGQQHAITKTRALVNLTFRNLSEEELMGLNTLLCANAPLVPGVPAYERIKPLLTRDGQNRFHPIAEEALQHEVLRRFFPASASRQAAEAVNVKEVDGGNAQLPPTPPSAVAAAAAGKEAVHQTLLSELAVVQREESAIRALPTVGRFIQSISQHYQHGESDLFRARLVLHLRVLLENFSDLAEYCPAAKFRAAWINLAQRVDSEFASRNHVEVKNGALKLRDRAGILLKRAPALAHDIAVEIGQWLNSAESDSAAPFDQIVRLLNCLAPLADVRLLASPQHAANE